MVALCPRDAHGIAWWHKTKWLVEQDPRSLPHCSGFPLQQASATSRKPPKQVSAMLSSGSGPAKSKPAIN